MSTVSFVIVGAGGRGRAYARFAEQYPKDAQVVAVCEPKDEFRNLIATKHHLPSERVFRDWRELLDKPKLADAAMICTQDADHRDPAIALAARGYHLLLEKPMAPTAADSQAIYDAVKQAGIMLTVCHGLRYTPYNRTLKKLLDSGLIGTIRNIDLIEPVGYWHQAHSFVRGHWRNSIESSPMLLAKSCHDLDFLNFLIPSRCARVASFGHLSYFTKANQPKGAADRCLECPETIESKCAYSAKKIYLKDFGHHLDGWPVNVVSSTPTVEAIIKGLAEGPYGRCVFACDNDVVDHQVVLLEFAGGEVATFTMSAFNKHTERETYVMGDRGTLRVKGHAITHYDFLTNEEREIEYDTKLLDSGHGGGDFGIMRDFIEAIRTNDPGKISSGPEVSLESHLIVFAAEESRRTGTVVSL